LKLEFFVRLLEQGMMTDWLRSDATIGDKVEVVGPYGQFFLRPPADRELLMVAGGTGLAPILSMLEVLKTLKNKPDVRVLYGANRPQELFGLEQLAAYGDWVTSETIVVDGGAEWQDRVGFVTDLIPQVGLVNTASVDAYLCGPPPMIDAASSKLLAYGVPS